MRCSFWWLMGVKKFVYWIVLNHLKNIWLQEDRDTRASELRSQKWSRYVIEKSHPFSHKDRGDCTKWKKITPFSQRRARRPFSIAVFTCTVTSSIASSGTRSTSHLFYWTLVQSLPGFVNDWVAGWTLDGGMWNCWNKRNCWRWLASWQFGC